MNRKLQPMLSLLLLWLLCTACSTTSADEAPSVQEGLGNQAQNAADITRESGTTDGNATATVSAAKAQAESTLVWDGVILTQTAAPPKATADHSRLVARTAAVNQSYRMAGWGAMVLILVLIVSVTILARTLNQRAGTYQVGRGLMVHRGRVYDELTGGSRQWDEDTPAQQERVQLLLAEITQDAPYSIEEPSYEPAALAETTG